MVVVMAVERGTSVISGVGLLYLDKYIYIYFFCWLGVLEILSDSRMQNFL